MELIVIFVIMENPNAPENLYTIEDYRALKVAIAQGAREVWYGDKRVAYRSLDEMLKILNLMESELGLNKCDKRRRVRYGSFSKGIR